MTVTLAPRSNYSGNDLQTSTAATGVPTLFATYVRTKGKRTYERVALTADFSEASRARHLAGTGGDSLSVRIDAGGDPDKSFPSAERESFRRRHEDLRAESRLVEAASIVDLIEPNQSVDCGLDDGLAFALRRVWDERRASEGRSNIMYSFALFAGKPETYEFSTFAPRPRD